MNKNDKLALKEIADHYGLRTQSLKLIEEMAELTQSLSKLLINPYDGSIVENVEEEIADVNVMLKQLIYLCGIGDEVNEIMHQKIARQLERIKDES